MNEQGLLAQLENQRSKFKLDVSGQLVQCSKCGRRILVERPLIGVNHTAKVIATCWDCLDNEAKKRAGELYYIEVVE